MLVSLPAVPDSFCISPRFCLLADLLSALVGSADGRLVLGALPCDAALPSMCFSHSVVRFSAVTLVAEFLPWPPRLRFFDGLAVAFC